MVQKTFTFMVSEHAKQLSAAHGAARRGMFCPSGNLAEGEHWGSKGLRGPSCWWNTCAPSAGAVGSISYRLPQMSPVLTWNFLPFGGL